MLESRVNVIENNSIDCCLDFDIFQTQVCLIFIDKYFLCKTGFYGSDVFYLLKCISKNVIIDSRDLFGNLIQGYLLHFEILLTLPSDLQLLLQEFRNLSDSLL